MNIAVLGAGAIGSLFAYRLATAGHNVELFTRDTEQSSRLLSLDDQPAITLGCNRAQFLESCDLLLVTVKSWQVEQAIAPYLTKLNSDTVLLFSHNGMGALDSLSEELERFPVVLATTTHGALLHSANHVSHTGVGETQLGGFNSQGMRCDFIADVIDHALPKAHWQQNINTFLWHKLAINCAINPLTALHQCANGDLALEQFQPTLKEVCFEVALVMKAEGVQIEAADLLAKVNQVIAATAANRSSMHQDIAFGRKTEIDFITGNLLEVAKRHQLTLPANQSLYTQLKQLESKVLARNTNGV